MSLTKRQQEILNGLMLGDGNITKRGNGNGRLRVNRSIKDRNYSEWIAKEFFEYCSNRCLADRTITDTRHNKTYERTEFSTRCDPVFTKEYFRWYNSIKIIPDDLLLTPLTLAIWFSDDGSISKRYKNGATAGFEISFATCSFGKNGTEKLCKMINNFAGTNLSVYGGYTGAEHYKIKGSTRDAITIVKIINSVMPPIERKTSIWREGSLNINRWIECPICSSANTFKNGFYRSRANIKIARKWKCKDCNNNWKVAVESAG